MTNRRFWELAWEFSRHNEIMCLFPFYENLMCTQCSLNIPISIRNADLTSNSWSGLQLQESIGWGGNSLLDMKHQSMPVCCVLVVHSWRQLCSSKVQQREYEMCSPHQQPAQRRHHLIFGSPIIVTSLSPRSDPVANFWHLFDRARCFFSQFLFLFFFLLSVDHSRELFR